MIWPRCSNSSITRRSNWSSAVAQADLVIASTDPDDARRQLITLTEKGEEILASLSLTHRDELRRFRSEMADILDELG